MQCCRIWHGRRLCACCPSFAGCYETGLHSFGSLLCQWQYSCSSPSKLYTQLHRNMVRAKLRYKVHVVDKQLHTRHTLRSYLSRLTILLGVWNSAHRRHVDDDADTSLHCILKSCIFYALHLFNTCGFNDGCDFFF